MLVSMCLEYGFKHIGSHQGDDALLKQMRPASEDHVADPLRYAIDFYPHYRNDQSVQKFLIPIEPRFHNALFADTSDTIDGLFADDPNMYGSPANTIKKAYLCHANIKTFNRGDILLFYRSRDRRSIQCVGILESFHRTSDLSEVIPLVARRTVYSRQELERMLSKETLVILFRFVGTIEPIDSETIAASGIAGPIQTIRSISHEQYQRLIGVHEDV